MQGQYGSFPCVMQESGMNKILEAKAIDLAESEEALPTLFYHFYYYYFYNY